MPSPSGTLGCAAGCASAHPGRARLRPRRGRAPGGYPLHPGRPLSRRSTAYNRIIDATNAAALQDGSYARLDNPNVLKVGWKLCIPGASAQPASPPSVISAPEETSASEAGDDRPIDGQKLTIDYLRKQKYLGSPLVVEETLAPGANYERSVVSYRSQGLKIYALLTVPQGDKPASGWPVIVFNHGYIQPEVYRTTERYVAYVDALARNGYIVLRPDYRGHGFSEGEARGAYGYPDYTVDVLNAVASIAQYADADPDRIGMWGHSMGGYITLRAMVATDDIKAGVVWAGVVASYADLAEKWTRQRSDIPERARRWRAQLIEEYGAPQENPQFWNSISANTYFADLSGPVQLHHGTADATVPIEFSATAYEQILRAGSPVEYYSYPGDDHNISASFDKAMARTVAFFDKHVKGEQ